MCGETSSLTVEYPSDEEIAERDADIDRDIADMEAARAADSAAAQNAVLRQQVSSTFIAYENDLLVADPDREQMFEVSLEDPNDRRPDEETPLLARSRTEIEDVLDNTKGAKEAMKNSAARRFILISLGVVVGGGIGVALLAYLRRKVQGKGTNDLNIPQAERDAIDALLTKWKNETDAAFWTNLANMIDVGLTIDGKKQPFTIADQVVFLNCVIQIFDLKEIWIWPSAKAIEENAEAIKAFYDKSGKLSDLYRNVLSVKGNNDGKPEVMPRAVAAQQLKLVLGMVSAA